MKVRKWVDEHFNFADPMIIPAMAVYMVVFWFLYGAVGLNPWVAILLALVAAFSFGWDHLTAKWRRKDDD